MGEFFYYTHTNKKKTCKGNCPLNLLNESLSDYMIKLREVEMMTEGTIIDEATQTRKLDSRQLFETKFIEVVSKLLTNVVARWMGRLMDKEDT